MAAYAAKDGGRNAVRTYSSLNQEEKKRANRNSLQARAQNASNPNSTIVAHFKFYIKYQRSHLNMYQPCNIRHRI